MSRITIPVDPYFIILQIPEYRVQTRQIRVGRQTQTRRERVQVMNETDSGWTTQDLNAAIGGANQIWASGQIVFDLSQATERRFQPPGNATRVTDDTYQYLINQMPGRAGRITLLLVRQFARWDLGGQASRGTCILPSTLTVNNRGRIFAHEFGHLLGLGHLESPGQQLQNVMRPGLVAGNQLTPDQIGTARSSPLARRMLAPRPQLSSP